MTVLLIIVIGLTLTVSAVFIISLIRSAVRSYLRRSKLNPVVNNTDPADTNKFNCRSVLLKNADADAEDAEQAEDSFKLEICGSIHAPQDHHETTARIFVSDITDGIYKAISVHSSVDQWQMKNSQIFCYQAELGSLPNAETILPEWMTVAQFSCDSLVLPRKGTRLLQFRTSIFSRNTNEEIAYAAFEIVYENPDEGYLDIEEDIYRANAMGTSLAFAFAASGGKKVSTQAVNFIKKWSNTNLDCKHEPGNKTITMQRILAKTLGRFPIIEKIRTTEICSHINSTAPLAIKCNILLLCLHVISASENISNSQINLLKNTAKLLDINTDRLRKMIEEIRPFSLPDVRDTEISLGITADMNDEQVREQLNTEYRKWNSRVINASDDIRSEAANMLELIGETKQELSV